MKTLSTRKARKLSNLERKHRPGFFCFRMDDSDGNDNTVHDIIVEARNHKQALAHLSDYLDALCKGHEHNAHMPDGSFGTFAPCDCHCDHQTIGFCEECEDTPEACPECGRSGEHMRACTNQLQSQE
jgi:hypothetical protein